ncbi:MAG TPA: ArgE/DapE family deacylase [Clostridiaceae bacterium]|nr:ArgE/DapE family deacylase [Clostridiaceae bacterium]
MKKILEQTLEKNRSKYLKVFTDLVGIDTQTIDHGIGGGKEINGQRYLEQLLSSMGAEIEKDYIDEDTIREALEKYNEGNPGHNNTDRYNLIATFHGNPKAKSILFNGHMDTMPIGNIEEWDTEPIKATEKDGKFYGLGTSDMKSGLAAAVSAVMLLQDAGIPLPGTVRIVSVVDEEGGGNGTLCATMHGYNADAAVLCEPTDCKIITANMGFIFFKVTVKGVSIHSGLKWQGVNAIEKAMLLIDALSDLEKEWMMIYKHPYLPVPTINIGVIDGGVAGSAVPSECSFSFCLHYIPGQMSYESAYNDVVNTLMTRSAGDKWLRENPPKFEVYQKGGAFETDREIPFVKAVYEAQCMASGSAQLDISYTGNDSRFYQTIAKIPVVTFGPGHAGKGHRPNEYVEIKNYYQCILAYAHLILKWCTPCD